MLDPSHARPLAESIGPGGTGGQLARARGARRLARIWCFGTGPRHGPEVALRSPCRWRRRARSAWRASRSCSRGIMSKTDSIGTPARETACGRGKREGSAPNETPGRFAAATPHPLGWERGGLDRRRWGARRGAVGTASNHGETRGASGRAAPGARRLRRTSRDAQQTRLSMPGPTGGARIRERSAWRAPPSSGRVASAPRRPQGNRGPRGGAPTPPLVHVFRFVVRRSLESRHHAGHLVCGGARLGGPAPHPSRRAAEGQQVLDEVSTATVQANQSAPAWEVPSSWGGARDRESGTRGLAGRPLTGASVRGSTSPPPGAPRRRARSRTGGEAKRVRGAQGLALGLPAFDV